MTDRKETIARVKKEMHWDRIPGHVLLARDDLTALIDAAEAGMRSYSLSASRVEAIKMRARYAALEEAAAIAINPYQDAVAALGTDEPFAVGKKIANAIRSLRRPT